MPIEYVQLKDAAQRIEACPKCGRMIGWYFLRGMVHSEIRKFFRMKYCAVICDKCKEIIGWEKP